MLLRLVTIALALRANVVFAQVDQDISEASSCIYAMHLNNSCIRKMDVLFRKECFHRLRDNEGQEESSFSRLILDLDSKKFLHLHRAERTTVDEKGEKKKEAWYIAAKYNHGKLDLSTPIMHGRPIARNFGDACISAELIDMRFAGLTGFPVRFGARGFDFEKRLATINVADNSRIPYRIENRMPTSLRIVQRAAIPSSQNAFAQMIWFVDIEKTMPFEFVSSTSTQSDGQAVANRNTSAQYSWKELSECFVPRSIDQVATGTHKKTSEDGKDQSYPYPRDEIFDFHWFSLNETISDSLIDGLDISSFEKWMPLTDPKLSHATDLEEREK